MGVSFLEKQNWYYGDHLRKILILFGLVWFYGISTIVGYLMPNPFL